MTESSLKASNAFFNSGSMAAKKRCCGHQVCTCFPHELLLLGVCQKQVKMFIVYNVLASERALALAVVNLCKKTPYWRHEPHRLLKHEPHKLLKHEPHRLLKHEPHRLLKHEPHRLLKHEPHRLLKHEPQGLLKCEPHRLWKHEPQKFLNI